MERRSIEIDGLEHRDPIPAATRIGPYVTCSIIRPFDFGTRNIPPKLGDQIDNLFGHVGRLLDGAEATWDDIAKMTFYVVDPQQSRPALTERWLERFPDPASRPSRHNLHVPTTGPTLVSCDFVAFVMR